MKKKDEREADLGLKQLHITPWIYHFETCVSPFTAITIAEDCFCRESVRARLDHILSNVLPALPHEKATRLRKELARDNIYGVAICNCHDTFSYQRGRTIAKGRLAKDLKERSITQENNNKIRELLKQGCTYDDPYRTLTEEQRVRVEEWYKTTRYLEI